MSKRMGPRGYGFVIAAAQGQDGQVWMTAAQCVRDIEIAHDRDDVQQWGGQTIVAFHRPETKITATLAPLPGHNSDHLVSLNVEQGGYAEAWRRLFDLWLPPQFTDETKTQILTHYTFGGM